MFQLKYNTNRTEGQVIIQEERRVLSVGHSRVITLPVWWLKSLKIQKGDTLIVRSRDEELVLTKKNPEPSHVNGKS